MIRRRVDWVDAYPWIPTAALVTVGIAGVALVLDSELLGWFQILHAKGVTPAHVRYERPWLGVVGVIVLGLAAVALALDMRRRTRRATLGAIVGGLVLATVVALRAGAGYEAVGGHAVVRFRVLPYPNPHTDHPVHALDGIVVMVAAAVAIIVATWVAASPVAPRVAGLPRRAPTR